MKFLVRTFCMASLLTSWNDDNTTQLYRLLYSSHGTRIQGRVTDPARRRVWPDETWQIIDADRRGIDPCRTGMALTFLISVNRYVPNILVLGVSLLMLDERSVSLVSPSTALRGNITIRKIYKRKISTFFLEIHLNYSQK